MRPGKIDGHGVIPVGAPQDWDPKVHGDCNVLHVRPSIDHGIPFLTSAWEPEADEVGWLLAGAKIELGISGRTHPVVRMGIGAPPTDTRPVYTIQTMINVEGQEYVRVVMFAPTSGMKRRRGGSVFCEAMVTPELGGFNGAVAEALRQIEAFAEQNGVA